MQLLILDTETTGTDPNTDKIIEIGAILYSVEHQTTLQQVSTLLIAQDNPAEPINRIPATALPHVSKKLQSAIFQTIQLMADEADFVVAHNAEFDAQFLPMLTMREEPARWLCTMTDFDWPRQNRPGESLVTLALNHGIGVSSAHRALTDCQLIAALFDRMTDLPAMLESACRPKKVFVAIVSYENRHLARAAGFKWNADAKAWTRRMAIDDTHQLPFKVTEY